MICPHCKVAVHEAWILVGDGAVTFDESEATGIQYLICPECNAPIIEVVSGPVEDDGDFVLDENDHPVITDEKIVYPNSSEIGLSEDIPDKYKEDFIEALTLVNQSPKASAALSRRLLQSLLTEVAKINGGPLSKQIEEFCSRKDIPSIIAESVDAIRQVGNFAAHPMKDNSTGEIMQVEPGEAEWSLDVLRGLFDYLFIQPARLKRRKDDLNNKLQALGKPTLK
ncbi:MAG: DUF4145 domain-containing protein [Anaerolineales bacterium]|jgi:hypothetical protein